MGGKILIMAMHRNLFLQTIKILATSHEWIMGVPVPWSTVLMAYIFGLCVCVLWVRGLIGVVSGHAAARVNCGCSRKLP
jgi:hypothetical protein